MDSTHSPISEKSALTTALWNVGVGMLPTAPLGAEPGIQGCESQGQGKNRHREYDSSLGLGTPERLIL